MRIRLLLLALLVPATMASAETPEACRNLETDPTLPAREVCTERVYFHCTSDNKVANVDNVTAPTTWDAEAPTASVSEGAGCGAIDTFATGTADHNPLYDAPFEGFYEGRIDALTLHAHVIDVGTARADDDFRLEMHLVIDGHTYFPRDSEIQVTPVPSSTGLSREIQVSVTGIGLTGLDDGGDHHVQLTLYAVYVDSNQNAWVWDTIEVPSGLMFNPTELAGAVVTASAP